jgi:type II secretory pathway pseudopilin PulG
MSEYKENEINEYDPIQNKPQIQESMIDSDSDPVPFWSENPNVFLQNQYMLEFFPVESMTYNQKLNAISRAVIVLGLISYFLTTNIRILMVSILTLAAIFILYFYQQREKQKSKKLVEEQFANQADEVYRQYNYTKSPDVFDKPTPENPFSNVLIPDINYNPDKKPAPPSFNANVNSQILKQAKQLVSDLNPGQPDISDKLFNDLGEQLVFEQSMRQFVSNPATTIPNDQKSFAEFCYGSMVSAKDGNPFALARNLPRYTNY